MYESHFFFVRPVLRQIHRHLLLLLLMWLLPQFRLSAQLDCSTLTPEFIAYEPCKYRVKIVNLTECVPDFVVLLEPGSYTSWSANTAGGWSGTEVSPGYIQLNHNGGFVPIGTSFPMIFTLDYGGAVEANFQYAFTCGPGVSCTFFPSFTLDACVDPQTASIIGTKYRECNALPLANQPVLSGWNIQLLNADQQVIAEQVTDDNGAYAFYDLPKGQYWIKEVSQPGWSPNIPATGQTIVDLEAEEQRIVNFGNCPSCSCDSIQYTLQKVSETPNGCCYRMVIKNFDASCFKNLFVTGVGGASITGWPTVGSGWTATAITDGVQLSHSSGFIPTGTSVPITFCVSGGSGFQGIHIATSYTNSQMSVLCEKNLEVECDGQSSCPNNLVKNGDFESGTPNGLDESIGLAASWSRIWNNGNSTGDFWNTVFATPTAAFSIFQTPTPALQGNFAGFWVKQNPNPVWREGVMNALTANISPGPDQYSLSAKLAALTNAQPTGASLPVIAVYGVPATAPAFGTFPGATGANTTIFSPAPILLGTFTLPSTSNNAFQTYSFTFSAPTLAISRIFFTRADLPVGVAASDCYVAMDDVCLTKLSPSCVCKPGSRVIMNIDGVNTIMTCNQPPPVPVVFCPSIGSQVSFTSDFGCVDASGAPCQPQPPIDWKLIGPTGVLAQGAVTSGSPWPVNISGALLNGSGNYSFYMTTLCPGQTDSCRCEVKWFQECIPCTCDGSSFDQSVRYGGGPNFPVTCGQTVSWTPAATFYPSFQCVGTNCSQTTVDWTLTGPGVSTGMTGVVPTPQFTIPPLTPGGLSAPGTYTLTMIGHCGTSTCTCTINFCIMPLDIMVRDTAVCRTDLQAMIPLENCPPANCGVVQVQWFVKTCSATSFPTTPYQVSQGPNCLDLVVLPYQYPGQACLQVYAVVTLSGNCCVGQLTSNVATITLCNPLSCNIVNPNPAAGFCQCATPQALTVNASGANCPFSYEWYYKGALVGTSSTYQPPQICFEGGPNDCYTDHVFTARAIGVCGPTTCATSIRVYNPNSPTGTISMVPNEADATHPPYCPGEDFRLVYDPKCTGEPPRWNWYISQPSPSTVTPVFPTDYTQITTAGNMNTVYYTNQLYQTTWYLVEKKNGACPAQQVPFKIEIKDAVQITTFTAKPDPCKDKPVSLSLDFTPAANSTGCQFEVDWYYNGDLIHTSTGSTSPITYTWTGTGSAAGVYYAVLRDQCCPQSEQSYPIIITPACEPVILGPCFKCDTITPITITGEMVLPPQDPCPPGAICTYKWIKLGMPIMPGPYVEYLVGTGTSLVITKGGYYIWESTCDYGSGNCVKRDTITIIQCESTGTGCQVLSNKDLSLAHDYKVALLPNPTAGEVQVLFDPAPLKQGRIEIVDINGRVLVQSRVPAGQTAHRMGLGHLSAGIYFTKVYEGDLLIWTGKIVRSE